MLSPRLLALCFGNFMIGTGTLIVPGMLPALAEGLQVSLPAAAQLITVFAFTICITAPILAGATSRFDRRLLLVALQLLFVVGHLGAAAVSSLGAMLPIRAITSISAGLYVAQAAATAVMLVKKHERGRAIAFAYLGWSIATVVGLPLGAYVGATLGWRVGFSLVAAGSLVSAVWLWLVLPAGLTVKRIDGAMWASLFRHPAILPVVGVTVLSASSQYVLFAYFVPAAHVLVDASPVVVSLLLASFGVFAVAGNLVSGAMCDRHGAARVVMVTLLVMLAGNFIWPFTAGAVWLFAFMLAVWGAGSFASNSAQQVRLATLSPQHAPVSIAFNSSAIYLGQGIGTLVAGALLARAPGAAGFLSLPWASMPLLVAAMALSVFSSRRSVMPVSA